MEEKKAAQEPSSFAENDDGDLPDSDRQEQQPDESPRVRRAAEEVRRARAELENARQLYRQVRQEATDELRRVREKTAGDLIEGVLELVKKHPGPGVLLAVAVGFFLGRLFRR